jgi:hypothetical protein
MQEDWNAKHVNKEALILRWRNDPVIAAKECLGVDLDKHQKIVIRNRWTHSTCYDVLSRGTGKTFTNGVFAALRGMLYPGHRVGLIAPSFRQSKMMFDEVRKLYDQSAVFQQAAPNGPKNDPEKCWIDFASAEGRTGSHIEAMPLGSDGGKIRGARFYDVIADELAQIDSNILNIVVRGFLATSANPMARVNYMREQREKIARGEMTEEDLIKPEQNKFIGSSTAFYQYNHLWERVQGVMNEIMQPLKQYQIQHQCTLEAAMAANPGYRLAGKSLNSGQIPYRVMSNGKKCLNAFTYLDPSEAFMNTETIDESRREMSDYLFRMEYECFFPPDSEGFFRRSMLDAARSHGAFSCQLEPRKGMKYAMGVDPARSGDNFAIAIFEIDPVARTINLIRVLTWNSKNFVEMHKNVRDLIRLYKIEYFEMDAGGGGTTIRDLLASQANCPIGQRLILERDFDEHRPLNGDRLLGPLIQFSSADWVHDANHNLLSGLQHNLLKIASKPPVAGEIWTQAKEEADEELEGALSEMSTIIVTAAGARMRWDTPTKGQRKDRYSAILVGYNAALKVLGNLAGGTTLACGGWI